MERGVGVEPVRGVDRASGANRGARSRLLVIAGRDSSGGAGVDADRAAAGAAGVDCECVITAETVQSSDGLVELGARPAANWGREARARLAATDAIGALKFGLLPGAEAVAEAAALVRWARARRPDLAVVVDPVLGPSSGGTFLDEEGRRALVRWVRREALVLTPNLPEALELARVGAVLDGEGSDAVAIDRAIEGQGTGGGEGEGHGDDDGDDDHRRAGPGDGARTRAAVVAPGVAGSVAGGLGACAASAESGPRASAPLAARDSDGLLARLPRAPAGALLLKDGHGAGTDAVDRLRLPDGRTIPFVHARVPGASIRGSGCRLASFLAARLATGTELRVAAKEAIEHVLDRLRASTGR